MSHSFAQDTFFLEWLLRSRWGTWGCWVRGGGRWICWRGWAATPCRRSLHAPAGLDIGAETPEQIALSILSEVQADVCQAAGGALRERDGSIHARELQGRELREDEDQQFRVRDCGLA